MTAKGTFQGILDSAILWYFFFLAFIEIAVKYIAKYMKSAFCKKIRMFYNIDLVFRNNIGLSIIKFHKHMKLYIRCCIIKELN